MSHQYSRFKYGTSHKYGVASGEGTGLTWGLDIAWSGSFSGENEAFNARSIRTERGRDWLIDELGQGFQPIRPGKMTAVLNNFDNRYTPYNTSSPLYPNVRPGVAFRLRVRDMDTGTVYDVMYGTIDDIRPQGQGKTVTITGSERSRLLGDQEITLPLSLNIDVEDAFLTVLAEAGWTHGTAIDPGGDLIKYFWARDHRVWELLEEISLANLGQVYIDKSGRLAYHNRYRTHSPTAIFTAANLQLDFVVPQPWDAIKNTTRLFCYPRTLESLQDVWSLGAPYYLDVNAVATFWAEYRYQGEFVPAQNVVAPVATTDYLANSNETGTGTNMTATLLVTTELFSANAKITVENNGASPCYVTMLKMRGQPLSSIDPLIFKKTIEDSVALYGQRTLLIDSPWLQDINIADSYSDFLADILSEPSLFPEIKLLGTPSEQFNHDLFDAIELTLPGADPEVYLIGKIIHEWLGPIGQKVITTLRLEPPLQSDTQPGTYWIFTTELGVTSYFGY